MHLITSDDLIQWVQHLLCLKFLHDDSLCRGQSTIPFSHSIASQRLQRVANDSLDEFDLFHKHMADYNISGIIVSQLTCSGVVYVMVSNQCDAPADFMVSVLSYAMPRSTRMRVNRVLLTTCCANRDASQ